MLLINTFKIPIYLQLTKLEHLNFISDDAFDMLPNIHSIYINNCPKLFYISTNVSIVYIYIYI